ncbi:2-oxoacid:ferredoxin oxidoreductase subunit beta [Wenzhouxiangella sp. AB-CW3]|uniref:thiamine pyrophosphate-dependent enzyme n=1 Tax=Wenzhouxiangella sp. AB-CW3 TaxID=2771012 RepID=UPI00168B8462|nr:thiamine pyrophosphate-dependent enzyme [Wenzhouxiangella sp. AB-CW3]QOC22480.1 2-oxoacid:ferredoxin oxidoreductase subunit beta [Wenzhouxiangella sp. AB-CW3]
MSSAVEKQISILGHKDFKSDYKPVWCAGCGDFGVLNALTKAMAALELQPENVAMIAGIGCSSRIPAYTSVYGFHGVHGRALPLAAGLAISRPDLTVIATGGDGDGFSIGGNHFLHACRRNVDMTYLVMDNTVYGMTKGQASPTTECDWTGSKLSPQGTGQPPLQPLEIALAAGAPYIARAFSNSPNDLARTMAEALSFRGFSFVQILSPCITFRPDQLGWKKRVHAGFEATDNRAAAFAALADDDGFTTGTLYRAPRPCHASARAEETTVQAIQDQFGVKT